MHAMVCDVKFVLFLAPSASAIPTSKILIFFVCLLVFANVCLCVFCDVHRLALAVGCVVVGCHSSVEQWGGDVHYTIYKHIEVQWDEERAIQMARKNARQ